MKKWKISLYLAALFLAGAVTGSFVSLKVIRHAMFRQRPDMAAYWCDELKVKLILSPEQVEKISPIINDSMVDFRVILTRRMLESMSNCNARIRVVLTPEQQAKFAEIERRQIEFVQGMSTNGMRPPHPD